LYGDHFRSPGRDDREDGAEPQRAPWETGSSTPQTPHEDVKVAGSPLGAPPGGSYGENATGEYDTSGYRPDATGAYGAQDTEATNPYGGGPSSPYDGAQAYDASPYGDAGGYEPGPGATSAYDPAGATTAYEAGPGATSAMPAFGGAEPPPGPDFEDMRRTPHADNRKVIRVAAVAAAVVVLGGGGAAFAMTGGGGGGKKDVPSAAQQPQQPAPAPLTDAQRKDAEAQRRKELKKRASRAARDQMVRPKLLAKGTPPPTKKPTDPAAGTAGDPVPAGEAQQIARAMLSSFGWSPSSQFGCLVNLWNRESHWNVHAANGSGAYGIPQALPGSKMSSAGPDWQNNAHTQIKWGLGYIKSRYSNPCGAWAHSQATGWY
jgi:hypothetical protein